jgi:hypothetical protein
MVILLMTYVKCLIVCNLGKLAMLVKWQILLSMRLTKATVKQV